MSHRDRRLDNVNNSKSKEYWTEAPPRWLNCPRIGAVVADRFIPFKTPLDGTYDKKVAVGHRFGVADVFRTMETQHKKTIGLWIDLTNTNRFYKQTEVEETHETTYLKINCSGHGECPSEEQTHLFIELCEKFFTKNTDSVIGIHCTHGFNRTGFLICAYLVEKFDWSIDAAVQEFAKARPPGIYKSDYLSELFTRYGEPEDTPNAPDLPSWCYEEETNMDDDGNQLASADGNDADGVSGAGNPDRSGRPGRTPKEPKFMEGVPGIEFVRDKEITERVQKKCKNMCRWQGGGFPGCQPVSMDKDNVRLIHDKEYRVSWKADGVRYMLLLDGEDEIYFLDRNNYVFKANGITFPGVSGGWLTNTLVDGEMVIDVVQQGVVRPRFLIYDLITLNNHYIGGKDFVQRYNAIRTQVVAPRTSTHDSGAVDRQQEPFSVRGKDFYEINVAFKILGEKFSRTMSHEVDGLIFQPVPDPYVAGRCDSVLKWKPPSMCTVDFKLKVEQEGGRGMITKTKGKLFVNGLTVPYGELKWSKEMKQHDKKILECTYDMALNKWVMMRIRTDKNAPNHFTTAQAVEKGIRNPLTKELLLDFIDRHGYRPQAVKRPVDAVDRHSDHDAPPGQHHSNSEMERRSKVQRREHNSARPPQPGMY